jgi:hypothetical protein
MLSSLKPPRGVTLASPVRPSHPRGVYKWYAVRMPNDEWECHEYDRRPQIAPGAVMVGPFNTFAAAMQAALNRDAEDGVKTLEREAN